MICYQICYQSKKTGEKKPPEKSSGLGYCGGDEEDRPVPATSLYRCFPISVGMVEGKITESATILSMGQDLVQVA